MSAARDLTGLRFGRLVVTGLSDRRGKDRYWNAACDCGAVAVVRTSALTRGETKSCGCLHRDTARVVAQRVGRSTRKHGGSADRAPEYRAWHAMLQRCRNPRDRWYAAYGGRGIAVAPEWLSYERFLQDVGPRPSADHSIDRIDNERGYEPGNVRWATRIEQARNRRTNRLISALGVTLSVSEWAERTGVNRQTIYDRLRRGWPEAMAVGMDEARLFPEEATNGGGN